MIIEYQIEYEWLLGLEVHLWFSENTISRTICCLGEELGVISRERSPLKMESQARFHEVQKLGRWKNISMVMRYAHHYPESLRSGAEILEKLGAESGTKSGTA